MGEDKISLSWNNFTANVPNTGRQLLVDEDFTDLALVTKDDQQSNLKTHQQSKYEGVRYNCDHCHHKATRQDSLRTHQQSKHEVFDITVISVTTRQQHIAIYEPTKKPNMKMSDINVISVITMLQLKDF